MSKETANQVRYRDRIIEAHWLKKNKCNHCGLKKSLKKGSVKFELDHINPEEKSFNISDKIKSLPWDEVLLELEKCQLLCFPCHKKKTAPFKGMNHGPTMYRTGCRCDICKAGNAALQQAFRDRKKI
jgi:5-methylcytosine-specific restriction endonuclease McrA